MRQLPLSKIHTNYVVNYNVYMDSRYDEIRFHLEHLSNDLRNLQSTQNQSLLSNLLSYVDELKNNVRRFVTMNPSDMKAVVDSTAGHRIKKKISIDKMHLHSDELCFKFERHVFDYKKKNVKKYKGKDVVRDKKFYEHIVDIMEYEKSKMEICDVYRKMGLKTCAYCNAQYAIGFTDGKEKYATYEFDHFYDKSDWPCFASSFYNLQPSCGSCNKRKLNKRYHFCLYSCSEFNLDSVKFQLPLKLFIDFWQKPQKNLLKIDIKPSLIVRDKISKVRQKRIENEKNLIWNEFVNKLHLESLYQEHRDEIEKALVRVKSNTLSYQNQLRKTYQNRTLQMFMSFHEFLYGFSEKKEDVHKQPLTKVKQDVFDQLSEIKSFGKRVK